MANYTIDLTPNLRTEGTEGGLDTSINSQGKSLQRTAIVEVYDEDGKKKTVFGNDQETFDEVAPTWRDNLNFVQSGFEYNTSGAVGLSSSVTVPLPFFLDNFNGAAGNATSGTADTGQSRVTPSGTVLLSGDGYAYLDDNSADRTILRYSAAPSVGNSRTMNVILTADTGESQMFVFNADYTGAGTGWGVYLNVDDDVVKVGRFTGLYPLSSESDSDQLSVGAIAPNELVEITVILNGDSITYGAKGVSTTHTVTNRLLKAQTGVGLVFNQYNTAKRVHKLEIF